MLRIEGCIHSILDLLLGGTSDTNQSYVKDEEAEAQDMIKDHKLGLSYPPKIIGLKMEKNFSATPSFYSLKN